jgi:hypothetical protein
MAQVVHLLVLSEYCFYLFVVTILTLSLAGRPESRAVRAASFLLRKFCTHHASVTRLFNG